MQKEIIEQPEGASRRPVNADERTDANRFVSSRTAVVLWAVSGIALVLAIFTAVIHITLNLIHYCQPNLIPWTLKSAVPLILIGIAFASLQFVLPRTNRQIGLGLMVALAFILWGIEQFLSNKMVASLIDDVVVLLFVLDLGIVIYGHMRPGVHSVGKCRRHAGVSPRCLSIVYGPQWRL